MVLLELSAGNMNSKQRERYEPFKVERAKKERPSRELGKSAEEAIEPDEMQPVVREQKVQPPEVKEYSGDSIEGRRKAALENRIKKLSSAECLELARIYIKEGRYLKALKQLGRIKE